MFSVVLCSWNDLDYLKLLYASLKKYTKLPYEIIVHDNGSDDGTKDWLADKHIQYTRSEQNLGVGAVNFAAAKAKYKYLVDINADMFVLPNWDIELFKQIKKFESNKVEKFIISNRLIEPIQGNPEYVFCNCGDNYQSFDEGRLLSFYLSDLKNYVKIDTNQYSHPICMSKKLWDEFGGADMSYKYGIATDHDLPASAYKVGCRHFIELAKPTIFHFSCKTVSKLPKDRPNGHETFLNKWGITIDEFRKRMKIGQQFEKIGEIYA